MAILLVKGVTFNNEEAAREADLGGWGRKGSTPPCDYARGRLCGQCGSESHPPRCLFPCLSSFFVVGSTLGRSRLCEHERRRYFEFIKKSFYLKIVRVSL